MAALLVMSIVLLTSFGFGRLSLDLLVVIIGSIWCSVHGLDRVTMNYVSAIIPGFFYLWNADAIIYSQCVEHILTPREALAAAKTTPNCIHFIYDHGRLDVLSHRSRRFSLSSVAVSVF